MTWRRVAAAVLVTAGCVSCSSSGAGSVSTASRLLGAADVGHRYVVGEPTTDMLTGCVSAAVQEQGVPAGVKRVGIVATDKAQVLEVDEYLIPYGRTTARHVTEAFRHSVTACGDDGERLVDLPDRPSAVATFTPGASSDVVHYISGHPIAVASGTWSVLVPTDGGLVWLTVEGGDRSEVARLASVAQRRADA